MSSSRTDDEVSIHEIDGLKRVLTVDLSFNGKGKIYLEGHDISHLVTSINIESTVREATKVHMEMVGLTIKTVK